MKKIGKYECPKVRKCKDRDMFVKGGLVCGHWNWTQLSCKHGNPKWKKN